MAQKEATTTTEVQEALFWGIRNLLREEVEEPLLVGVRTQIRDAGDSLRENNLPRLAAWGEQCRKCDLAELCRDVPASDKAARRAASGR